MDVAVWLRSLGLERLEAAFRDNEIDWDVVPELTESDLEKIGLPLGPRKKLLKAIAALGGDGGDGAHGAPDAPTPATRAERQAGARAAGERRQVTVLFADLSGYTRLSSELDAEDTHALLGRFFERVDGIVEAHGGTIDKHIGDCVMAVFGAPIAHDNDPERAARAALAIRDAMPAVSRAVGRTIGVHVGIAAGQVVASGTGSASHQEYTVTGDSVNLAARLNDRARNGEILVSEAVRLLLPAGFALRHAGALSLEGLAEPVVAWHLLEVQEATPASPRPFVGRRAEVAQLEAVLGACLDTGTGRTVHVRGEAGIGKTRLLEEFQRLASGAGFACHGALVLDFGTGSRRDVVRSLFRALLDLGPTSDAAAAAAAAGQALERGLIAAADQVFLNDLLDLPQPAPLDAFYEGLNHAARYQGKRETLATLASNASRQRPRLLLVENLHWADAVTLDYLANLARAVASCRALLVLTSRIEGDPLDQAWRAAIEGCPLMTLDLGPLRASEAEALAGAQAGAGGEFARRCVERAGGNPLFLEQLLRHAEESIEGLVPGSVQSLVQARLDQLAPADRQALQAASVFGQRFTLDALRHLLASPNYTCAGLIERQLVRRIGDDLLFGHALIRDAVYDTLLRARRRDLHRQAAAWFGDSEPVLFAEHLDRADDPSAALAYLAAARGEGAAYRYQRARRLVERGLERASTPADRFALTCHLGELLHDLGAMADSRHAFQGALEVAKGHDQRCRAWLGLAGVKRVTDDVDGAFADLEQAEAAARAGDLREQRAHIHFVRGNLYFPRGDIEGCLGEHRASLELARAIGSAELEVQALGGLGDGEYVRGRMRSAYANFERCIALSQEHGFDRIGVANLGMLAHSGLYFRPQRSVLADARQAAEAARRIGHRRAEVNAHTAAMFVASTLDDAEEVERQGAEVGALIEALGALRFQQSRLQYLGRAALAQGRQGEALDLLERALAIAHETGIGFHGPRIHGTLALARDDPDGRRRALAEGEALIQAGCVGHNQPWFYADAIQTMLDLGDWDEVERYARALEGFTAAEPLAWCDLFIARGRALATLGRGQHDERLMAELRLVRDEARRLEILVALPAIEQALAAIDPGAGQPAA